MTERASRAGALSLRAFAPLIPLRAPKLFNLRSDPFERAEQEAGDYVKWFIEHVFLLVPAQSIVAQHPATFQEFPPRQKPGSF